MLHRAAFYTGQTVHPGLTVRSDQDAVPIIVFDPSDGAHWSDFDRPGLSDLLIPQGLPCL